LRIDRVDELFNYFPMQIESSLNYREFLKNQFDVKRAKNPSYSLRSFARTLDMSPSHLSRVLSGKKQISLHMGVKVSEKLKLKKRENQFFLNLIQLELSNDPEQKIKLLKKLEKNNFSYEYLDLEKFNIISEWYHFAILSLAKTHGFSPDPNWIAKRLGIQINQAKRALERLINLNLLIEKDGSYIPLKNGNISTTDDIASQAIKENHRQNIEKSLKALIEVDISKREFINQGICIRESDLPKIKKIIRSEIDKINRDIESENGEEVYQLNLQFFPVSKKIKD